MGGALVSKTLDQLQEATEAPAGALVGIQAPGGPTQSIKIANLLGSVVKADVVAATIAGLTLAWDDGSVGYVYAPPSPDIPGYYLKSGASGVGAWTWVSPGAAGLSAYQIWLQAGNTGSEADYLASLVGPPGSTDVLDSLDDDSTTAPPSVRAVVAGFAAAGGAARVNTNKGDAYSIVRDTSAILAEIEILISDYNGGDYDPATGTGTDLGPYLDKAAARIQALSNNRGGRIRFARGFRGYLGTNWTAAPNIKLWCDEAPLGYNSTDDVESRGAVFYINSAASIYLQTGAQVRGLGLYRAGLRSGITRAEVDATFLGTAIKLAAGHYDQVVEDCFILGFNQLIASEVVDDVAGGNRNNRYFIRRVRGDGQNGIHGNNAFDIPVIQDCHFWPWLTISSAPEAGSIQLKRNGTGYWLSGQNDWSKIINCFCYAYQIGFRITGSASVTIQNCGADHVPGYADGSIGALLEGAAREICLDHFRAAGKDIGIKLAGTYGASRLLVSIIAPFIWYSQTAAIYAQSGDYEILGGTLRNTGSVGVGLQTTATSGAGSVRTDFRGFATAIANFSRSTVTRVDPRCTFTANAVQIALGYYPALASASSIVPNGMDFEFAVTGSVPIGTISSPERYLGRGELVLFVQDGVTFQAGGVIILKSGANTAYAAGTYAKFRAGPDSKWREQ